MGKKSVTSEGEPNFRPVPQKFASKRRGQFSPAQMSILYYEYYMKGFTTTEKMRERLAERGDDMTLESIQRKIAYYKQIEKN